MNRPTRLRVNVNARAVTQATRLISNTAVLTANLFLIGSGLLNQVRDKKRERTMETLTLSVQVANAAAGLTRVIQELVDHDAARTDH